MNHNELIQDADGVYLNLVIDQTEGSQEENMSYQTQAEIDESTEMDLEECTEEDLRRGKRLRTVDQDEVWTQVTRSGKKRIVETTNSSIEVVESKIEVCITCKEILPKQFALARLFKSANIKDIIRVKYVNPYKILVTFNNEESASQLVLNKSFTDKGWRCQKTLEVGLSFGVLRDCEVELEEAEILESLSSPTAEIVSIKRLNYRDAEGKWVSSECIRICFKGSTLPAFVYIHGIKTRIDPYKFPVTQCSKCWRFGHSGKLCPSRRFTCPKCSENHANCETNNYKCANCGGRHMALYKKCPEYLKERKIRELMSEFNCTYRMALNMYVPPSPREHITKDIQHTSTISHFSSADNPAINKPDINTDSNNGNTKTKLPEKSKKNTLKQKVQFHNTNYTVDDWENASHQSDTSPSNTPPSKYNEEKEGNIPELLRRLKEVIIMKKYDLMAKIKMIVQILGEWILSYVVKNINALNLFEKFFNG